jgi:hypothetical protein
MKNLLSQIVQDNVWNKWVSVNSVGNAGCISARKEGCISSPAVAKEGCISIAQGKQLPKAGCIS